LDERRTRRCTGRQFRFAALPPVSLVVIKTLHNDGYEPIHNPLFQRLLDHYGVISIPARPHHPKDKPLDTGQPQLTISLYDFILINTRARYCHRQIIWQRKRDRYDCHTTSQGKQVHVALDSV
jgi:hypothetical protein